MECIDLSASDALPLYEFYAALPESMSEVFRPFPDPTAGVIRKHLEETAAGRHISVGLVRQVQILGHGFVMNIEAKHPVFGLCVYTSVQGRGWGRRLMSTVMERARRFGVRHMTLTVVARNTRALALYKSFGFKIAARHTFREPGDSFIMRYDEDGG